LKVLKKSEKVLNEEKVDDMLKKTYFFKNIQKSAKK
jgi:hypothetical protein